MNCQFTIQVGPELATVTLGKEGPTVLATIGLDAIDGAKEQILLLHERLSGALKGLSFPGPVTIKCGPKTTQPLSSKAIGKHVCDKCGKSMSSKTALELHKTKLRPCSTVNNELTQVDATYKDTLSNQCPNCKRCFYNQQSLMRHKGKLTPCDSKTTFYTQT